MFEQGDKDLLNLWNKDNKKMYTIVSIVLAVINFTFTVYQFISVIRLSGDGQLE